MNLKPGEMICPRCKGSGTYVYSGTSNYEYPCKKCHGKGKLNWIENIVGVRGWHIEPGVYIREVDICE